MKEEAKEEMRLQLTKFELAIMEKLKEEKGKILSDRRARDRIEKLRSKYLLQEKTILMFRFLEMLPEYTSMLMAFNKVLDGDLT